AGGVRPAAAAGWTLARGRDRGLRGRSLPRLAEPQAERPGTSVRGPLSRHRRRRRSYPRRLPGGAPDPRGAPTDERLRRLPPPRPRDGDRELLPQVVAREHARVLLRAEVSGAGRDRPVRSPAHGTRRDPSRSV